MRGTRVMSTSPILRPGFTLVEVLFAIVLLLGGIIFALKVFPAGFNAFTESQQNTRALALVQQNITAFQEDPGSLPDAIVPLDYLSPAASAEAASFSFDDLTAVDFMGGWNSPGLDWDLQHRAVLNPSRAVWPFWQPVSVRAPRLVLGERCVIPSDFAASILCTAAAPSSGTTVSVSDASALVVGMRLFVDNPTQADGFITVGSIAGTTVTFTADPAIAIEVGALFRASAVGSPAYVPRFGPVAVPWVRDLNTNKYTWPMDDAHPPVTVYDLRYRTVSAAELDALQDHIERLPDLLDYAADYAGGTFTFLPDARPRKVRFTMVCRNAAGDLLHVPPQAHTLPADGSSIDLSTASGTTLTLTASTGPTGLYVLTLPSEWRVLPGSEQLNRAYIYVQPGTNLGVTTSTLQSGEYTANAPRNAGDVPVVQVLYFSAADAGRTVKMDYIIADWSILHEDVTVGDDGYLTLAVTNPKVSAIPTFPREPEPWGLYAPMVDGEANAVMGLVHLRTGLSYEVVTRDARANGPAHYSVKAQSPAAYPGIPVAVDYREAINGRVRLGGLPAGTRYLGAWSANGAYAIDDVVYHETRYYQNVTGANSGAPGSGAADWVLATPDWTALRGQVYRIYYRAARDWTVQFYRPPAQFWYMSTTANFDELADPQNTADLDLGWTLFSVEYGADNRIAVPGLYEHQTVAVDYRYRSDTGELRQASGEIHTIPTRVPGKRVSLFALDQTPEPGSLVTVRGVSLTVRALWIQPRAGQAVRVKEDGTTVSRALNERWQAKTVTVILPSTKE